MKTQQTRGLTACITTVCCCLLLTIIAAASPNRDSDKALRAQQLRSMKQKNPSGAVVRESKPSKQSSNSVSANKQQILKKQFSMSRTRPEKAPFTGHPSHPDQKAILQGGDDVATALMITSLPFTDAGSTSGYTDDYDESCPYDAPGSADVVYKYSPASSTAIDIDLCPSGYDTKVYVYENSVGTVVACNDDADACDLAFRSQLLNVPVSAGNTYYIVVDGYGGDDGDYDITVTEHIPCIITCPANHVDENESCGDATNDGCNALPEAFGDVKCGDTICGTAWADGGSRDTDWYIKTITADTTFSWCGTANFDFVLIVANLSGGCANLDDGDIVDAVSGQPCDTACITATLAPGTYLFFVAPGVFDGLPCANGPWNYAVWLDCAEPPAGPANNTCANATSVGNVTNYPFTNINATTDGPDEPGACDFSGYTQIGSDVWFCYTATCSGVASVSLCGSDFDTKMAVYAGCSCPTTPPIACNDDYCGLQSQVLFSVSAGSTYLIRAGGYAGDQGNGMLTISCGNGAQDDNCADVTPQTLPAVFTGDNTLATNDCDQLAPDAETWAAFTTTECSDVTVSFCGTDPAFETVYVVLSDACPCGNFIFANYYNFTDCSDGNVSIHFTQLPAGTYYYPILASASENSLGPYTVTITGAPCSPYCAANGFTCDEYISRVAVGSIDNSSDCENYSDYTALSTTMNIGTGYPITVENGNGYSDDQCGIWVDWNQDNDFDDADESIAVTGTPSAGPYSGTIMPPPAALSGPTRMRTRITYTGDVLPCGVTDFGEVEDYTVLVTGGAVGPDLTIKPDTITVALAHFIAPIFIILDLGNNFAPGYDVNDINLSTIQVNGVSPDSAAVLPGAPGFSGPVLKIQVRAVSFVWPAYQLLTGRTHQTAVVTGDMNDATPFSTTSEQFVFIGHPAGDLNQDDKINIQDLTFMVAFLFAKGQPPYSPAAADVNHNGTANVQDLTYLIRFLFNGGPAPIQPQD